jgi:hypothetical protein
LWNVREEGTTPRKSVAATLRAKRRKKSNEEKGKRGGEE